MKNTDPATTACAALAACLLVMAFVLALVLGGWEDDAILAKIRENALRTAGDITSYHAVVEVSFPGEVYSRTAGRREQVEDAGLNVSEVWVKGPDLHRESSELVERQYEGLPPSSSTLVFNEKTFACMGSDNIQIDYNCSPDLHLQMGSSYDLVRELNALTQEGAITLLGEENINGTDTYKLEKKYDGDEGQGTLEREVIWVDQASSICLKKEAYQQGELRSGLKVVSLEMNGDVPDGIFAIETEGWRFKEENDMGYRDISLDQVGDTCGFEPLLPSRVPEGYGLTSTGWRDESVNGIPLDLPVEMMPFWYKPFYLTYTDGGIVPIVICEAKENKTERADNAWLSFMLAHGPVSKVDLAGGLTGYYWNCALYFILDGTQVSISAYLPLEELMGIAESFR